MSFLTLPRDRRLSGAGTRFDSGPASRVAAAHRAALARGVTFALLLASSSLACVYIPAAAGGAAPGRGWTENPAAPR